MQLAMTLLQILASTRAAEVRARAFVSGAALAQQLGVSRTAVWKAVEHLRELGTEVEAVTHQGYRLAHPASPLSAAGVGALLPAATRQRLRASECLGSVSSTNSLLLERGPPPPGQFDFVTAEHQHAGRGRRGRTWLAPPGGSICLSWSWCFEGTAAQLGPLSLVIGVACNRALHSVGVPGVLLKWPNDLVTDQGKLGGILIEMRAEAGGPVHLVMGLGLNVALGPAVKENVSASGNRATDLCAVVGAQGLPTRDALVAAVLHHGVAALLEFTQQGFQPFRAEFKAADALIDQPVDIHHGSVTSGIARGVDLDGALLVEHHSGSQLAVDRIIGGEVSVRKSKA